MRPYCPKSTPTTLEVHELKLSLGVSKFSITDPPNSLIHPNP
jgi:hypothetical protein